MKSIQVTLTKCWTMKENALGFDTSFTYTCYFNLYESCKYVCVPPQCDNFFYMHRVHQFLAQKEVTKTKNQNALA